MNLPHTPDADYDFVVIGGGIIGLTCALALQEQHKRVCLLEAEPQLVKGTSWGNAGHIATEQIYPLAEPSMLAKIPSMLIDPLSPLRIDWTYVAIFPWFLKLILNMRPSAFQKSVQGLRQLNQNSGPAWDRLTARYDLQPYLHQQGSYLICEKPQTQQALMKHSQTLTAQGVSNYWLNQPELQRALPALAHSQLGALFFPETAHIANIAALSQQLEIVYRSKGGKVKTQFKVQQAEQTDTHIQLVSTANEKVTAQEVLISSGAFSKPLVKQLLQKNIPLETERGYHLMLPHECNTFPAPVSSADRKFIMTPMAGGLRLAGTVEFAGLQKPPVMQRAYNLLKLAQDLFQQPLNQQAMQPWMGFRPTLPDSLPIIDRIGKVYLALGHQHLGLTQAAYTAELISQLTQHNQPTTSLERFRLSRF